MCERIFDRDICEIFTAATAKWAATCREKQSSNSGAIIGRTKTLMDGSVFTIDGNKFGARSASRNLHNRAGRNQRFFIGQCKSATCFKCRQRDRQAGKSDHTVHHDIGFESEARHCIGTTSNFDAGEFDSNESGCVGITNRNNSGSITSGLFDDHFRLATRSPNCGEFKVFRFGVDDLERLRTY